MPADSCRGCDACGHVYQSGRTLFGRKGRVWLCLPCYRRHHPQTGRVATAVSGWAGRTIAIDDETLAWAERWARVARERRWYSDRESIRDGYGYFVALLGERAVHQLLGGKWLFADRRAGIEVYDYDLILATGRKIDVKTKERTVDCRGEFFASVPAASYARQQTDYYVFASFNRSTHILTICGCCPKADMVSAAAVFGRRGNADPSDDRFRFRADCHNLAYRHLWPMEALMQTEHETTADAIHDNP